jgi:hypothetical protein
MAEHRHPHCSTFRAALETMRRLARGLSDLERRSHLLPEIQRWLIQITSSDPPPSLALFRELFAMQADLSLLFVSPRPEHELLVRFDLAIVSALRLADEPPLGYR